MADDSLRNLNGNLPSGRDNNQSQAPWQYFGNLLAEILKQLQSGGVQTSGLNNRKLNTIWSNIESNMLRLGGTLESLKEQADKLRKTFQLQVNATGREVAQLNMDLSKKRTLSAQELILKQGELRNLQERQTKEKSIIDSMNSRLASLNGAMSELLVQRRTFDAKQEQAKSVATRLTSVREQIQENPENEELLATERRLEKELDSLTSEISKYNSSIESMRSEIEQTLRDASDSMRDVEDDFRYSMDRLRDGVSDVSDALGIMSEATSNASSALKSVAAFEEKLQKNDYERAMDAIEQSRRAVNNLYNKQSEQYDKLVFAIQNGIDEFGRKLSDSEKEQKVQQLQQLRLEIQRTKQQQEFYKKLTPAKDIWIDVGNQMRKVGFDTIKGMANNVASYFTKRFVDDTFDSFNKVYQSIETTRNEISARLRMNQGDFSDMISSIQQEIEDRGLEGSVAQSDVNEALVALTASGITDRDFIKELALESAKLRASGVDLDLTNEETLERFQNLQGQGYSIDDIIKLVETSAGQMQATKDILGSGTAFIGGGGNTILNQVLDVGTAFGKSVDQMSEDIGSALYSAQAVKLGGADPQMFLEKINSFIENPLGNQDKFTLAWAQRMGYVNDKGTITADDIANMSYDEIIGSMNQYMQEIFANQDAMLVPYLKDVYGISAPTTQLLRMGQSQVSTSLPADFASTVADTVIKTEKGLQNATWISETAEGLNKRENLMAEQATEAEKFYKGDVLFNGVTEPVVSAINEIKTLLISGGISSLGSTIGKLAYIKKLQKAGIDPSKMVGDGSGGLLSGLGGKLSGVGGTAKNLLGKDKTTLAGKIGNYGGAAVGGALVIDSILDADSARDVFTDPEFYAGLSGGIASAIGGPIAGAVVGGIAGLGAKYGNWLGEKSVASDPILEGWNASENALTEAANKLMDAANSQLNAAQTEYDNLKKMTPQQKRLMLLQGKNISAEEANNLSDEEINKKFEELVIAQQEAEIRKKQAEVKRANLLASSKGNLTNLQMNLGDLGSLSSEAGSGKAGLSEQAYRVMQLLGSGTSEQLTSAIFDAMAAQDGLSVEAAVAQVTEGMGVTDESRSAITQFAKEIDKQKGAYDENNRKFQDKWKAAKSAAGTDDISMIALKYAEMFGSDIKNGELPNIKTTGPSGSFQMDSNEPVFLDASGLPVLADNHGTYDPKAYEGRFKAGMTRVPHDNYIALLHEGERVLTAKEAEAYNNISSVAIDELAGDSINNFSNISEGSSVIESILSSGVVDNSEITGSIDSQTGTLEKKLDAILLAIQGLTVALKGTPRPTNSHTDVRRMNSNLTAVNTGF